MKPIFGRNGNVIAWLNDTNIYLLNGKHAGVLNVNNVYGQKGQQLGVYENGLFRDNDGGVVAFTEGASGGLILPITSIPPIPPILTIAPILAIPSIPLIPAIPKIGWGISWDQFINA